MTPHAIALMTSILLGVVGQISLKAAALQGGEGIGLYLQRFTFTGLSAYFAAALLYTYSLKEIPLSIAFPSVSISYVVVSLLAHVIWGEPFGAKNVAALLAIGAGIYILSRPQ